MWISIIIQCISIDAYAVRRPDVICISLSQRPWRTCSRPFRAGRRKVDESATAAISWLRSLDVSFCTEVRMHRTLNCHLVVPHKR